MDEEINNELLRKADIILKQLDKEIMDLPRKQVWCCKNKEEIISLIDRMEIFIDSCYSAMSGTMDKTREMLTEMINMAEKEISEAESILYSLGKTQDLLSDSYMLQRKRQYA